MEKQSKKTVLLIGLTLFSMFFGAGNLIFPPILGAQAQGATVIAMIGFCITAICFPILGVIVVNKSDGIKNLANRVNPVFSKILVFLIYLSIGPMLAIPRTASTSFEIAALPFLPENSNIILWRVIYSVLFFGVAFLVALRPDKLTDRLGKILCPCLLTLIAVVFIGSLFAPTNQLLEPALKYQDIAFVSGFLDGYQTMDTLAALNFGAIIALNIKAKGIKDKKSTHNLIIKSGIIAGVLLLIVYA
ncbi:MAG: branched-chain amino acid transport system II carrier protein, partial [Oscillospiraceae bacterium]